METVFPMCDTFFGQGSNVCETIAGINENFAQLFDLMNAVADKITELQAKVHDGEQAQATLMAQKQEVDAEMAYTNAELQRQLALVQAEAAQFGAVSERRLARVRKLEQDLRVEQDRKLNLENQIKTNSTRTSELEKEILELQFRLANYEQLEPALKTVSKNLGLLTSGTQNLWKGLGDQTVVVDVAPQGGPGDQVENESVMQTSPTGNVPDVAVEQQPVNVPTVAVQQQPVNVPTVAVPQPGARPTRGGHKLLPVKTAAQMQKETQERRQQLAKTQEAMARTQDQAQVMGNTKAKRNQKFLENRQQQVGQAEQEQQQVGPPEQEQQQVGQPEQEQQQVGQQQVSKYGRPLKKPDIYSPSKGR